MSATDQTNSPPTVMREAWADLIALERTAPPPPKARKSYRRQIERAALFATPIALAWLAMRFLMPASYVSETSFILRHQAEPLTLPSANSDFTGAPTETGSADSYAVRDYLLSRDAMAASGGVFKGDSNDARFGDFSARVQVDYDTSSGVITVRAAAPDAKQAYDLASGLRNAAENLVARFDQASAASEYVAPLAEPNVPDGPTRPDQPLVLLGAAALGLALAWGRSA